MATITKLDELKTYYQRKWEFSDHGSGGTWSAIVHIGTLTLPFIGLLYKPAGRAISFTATSWNVIQSAAVWRLEGQSCTRKGAHLWSIVKNGAELIGTVANLRIGLAIHTVMNLGQHLYEIRDGSLQLSTTKKLAPIVSNVLYLLTFVSFSNPVSYGILCSSLAFQAFLSWDRAANAFWGAKTWTEMKILDAAAHLAMMLIFCEKTATALAECFPQSTEVPKETTQPVPRTFVLMQSLSKLDQETLKRDLFRKGKELAESVTPVALRQFAQQNGQQNLVYYISKAHRAQSYMILINAIISADDPFQIRWKPLPLEERWVNASDAESPDEVASHMDGAIRILLDELPPEDGLPVVVSGGTAMTRYLEAEIHKNREIPANITSGIIDGDMRVVTMTPDEMGDLQVTKVVAVDPKKL